MNMHYEKSPIVEALIDIRTEPRPGLKFEDISTISKFVGADYPRTETRYLSEGTFSFGAETKATAEQKPLALMFFSSDNKQIFQARTDGITFSRLAPYQTWNMLRDETRRLWKVYKDFVGPLKVTRLAARYINQFVFPGTLIEPEDYLKTFAELSRDLPKELRNIGPFSMRLSVPQTDLGGMLVISEAFGGTTAPDTVPIVLDLDLYVENLAVKNDGDLWDRLEQFRKRKNLYFEACITDRTRELIS
jgi:uncharacterized protein (TIGR04255 family)